MSLIIILNRYIVLGAFALLGKMQIPYELKDAGMGIGDGLFSLENLPSGTIVWKFTAGVNVNIYNGEEAAEYLEKFKDIRDAQRWLDLTYGFKGNLCEITDDGKYMNHCTSPNCRTRENGDTYTIREIEAGEQLFEDYTVFGK